MTLSVLKYGFPVAGRSARTSTMRCQQDQTLLVRLVLWPQAVGPHHPHFMSMETDFVHKRGYLTRDNFIRALLEHRIHPGGARENRNTIDQS